MKYSPEGQEPTNNGEAVPLMAHCSHCGSYEPVGQSTIDGLASTAEAQARALEEAADNLCRNFRPSVGGEWVADDVVRLLRKEAKRIREEAK